MSSALLLLSRGDVERVLSPAACIDAVAQAFRQHAEGRLPPPGILGMHGGEGSFHVKASFLALDRAYFAAKLNANFPRNGARGDLPTIQGVAVLFNASNGTPLAIMDSASITALRTAAASALAARHLAHARCETVALLGCGAQAAAQLRALLTVRSPRRVLVHDLDPRKAERFAATTKLEAPCTVEATGDVRHAIAASRIVITCTTARKFFVAREDVMPGTFVAAVGADSEDKQEIDPALLARSKVVTDVTAQAAAIGDLHHAIAAGRMPIGDVHAELGEVVAGRKPGRTSDDEIIVFDSTGTGLQDAAAAAAAYRAAVAQGVGKSFELAAGAQPVTSR
jgi:ornithine cyclodeaminase/alanine dehydrogenase-like protein (mu-crystallin family)